MNKAASVGPETALDSWHAMVTTYPRTIVARLFTKVNRNFVILVEKL